MLPFAFLLVMMHARLIHGYYKVCEAGGEGYLSVGTRQSGGKSTCKGCDKLQNCTTVLGSVRLQGIVLKSDKELKKQLRFPHLTEITGHLIVSFIDDTASVSDILPNLAVIHGRVAHLFMDYALVIYRNAGLRHLGLNALTVVKEGGIKIEYNTNLCYLDSVRWKSLMSHSSVDGIKYDLAIREGNSKDCFEKCRNCSTPSGHGSSGITYCWGGGQENCQRLCSSKCGSSGCERKSQKKCCHPECFGGCTKAASPNHCHACQHLRQENGTCVQRCPAGLKEVHEFYCLTECHGRARFLHNGKCVQNCPAGYTKNTTTNTCDKCSTNRCPRVCRATELNGNFIKNTFKVNSLSESARLRGCTLFNGDLEIELGNIRGGSNIAQSLIQDLGSIEEVTGYVVVRQSNSLISLNFFKNLKTIRPKLKGFSRTRYGLAIFDNPNLENLWDFYPNFTIVSTDGCPNCGVLVQLNPQLCLHKVYPLIDNVLKWNRTDPKESRVDISETTNGNSRTCDAHLVNISIEETKPCKRCKELCVFISWPNKVKDHRNVLLYSIWYRETTSQNISEYDDIDACSSDHVWERQDVSLTKTTQEAGKTISQTVCDLRAFTLYAFRLEAFVIANKGVKSNIAYFKTKQTKPSAPLSLQANFLSLDSLQIKWLKPFFPNGNITHYIIRYQERNTSYRWNDKINWCQNQDSKNFRQVEQDTNSKDTQKDSVLYKSIMQCDVRSWSFAYQTNLNISQTKKGSGTSLSSCAVNITCDCDDNGRNKNKKELERTKKAALFAIKFQDLLLSQTFSKTDKDNDKSTKPPVSNGTRIPVPNNNASTTLTPQPDCGNKSKNSSCMKTTEAPLGPSNTPVVPVKQNRSLVVQVFRRNTTKRMIVLDGLQYFTEYSVEVCACNSGAGCATNKGFVTQCAKAVGRTDKNGTADNVGNTLSYTANNETRQLTLRWKAPEKPNGAVLRYDVLVKRDNKTANRYCLLSSKTEFKKEELLLGHYSAKVRAITPVGNGSWSNIIMFDIVLKTTSKVGVSKEEDVKLAAIVGISLAAIVVVMVACAFLLYFYMQKRFEKAKETGVIYASVNPEYMNCSEVYVADEWEVPREKITLLRELGNGSFGMVYEGEARDILPGEQCCKVAVKTVCETASLRDKVEFLKEASIMKAFNCDHVVRLLGVVSAGQPALVVMELMTNGDLKSFLRKRRPNEVADENTDAVLFPPTNEELFLMAAEIADGMAYLSARKFVHRDLAARNCMVSENLTCKIGDFGMARDVYETDYYRKGGKGFLPVRWMSPESLKDGIFSSASDVWSFGVVLWEMATLAEQPYQGKSNEEVMKYVVAGSIMDCPDSCPQILSNIMMRCWQQIPKARPTFLSIVSDLEQFVTISFMEKSFYHNRELAATVTDSCVSLETEKDSPSVPRSTNQMPPSPMTNPDARESCV